MRIAIDVGILVQVVRIDGKSLCHYHHAIPNLVAAIIQITYPIYEYTLAAVGITVLVTCDHIATSELYYKITVEW